MKLKTTFFAILVIAMSSCKKEEVKKSQVEGKIEISNGGELRGTYKKNQHVLLTGGVVTLTGYTYFEDGSSIEIAPGTIIKSNVSNKGALIIERGAKIIAEGKANSPIVFTSGRSVNERQPGDWGGIILLGRASVNATNPTIEGGVGRQYGGNDDQDNSGILKYVRIEFAGIAAELNSEINGLTLGGVGAGTTLEHIMVSYGNDDAFEFFGGTVNAKYLISYATADDDFDFDAGYTGSIQFAVSLRDPGFVDSGDAGNGIECDNNSTGTEVLPRTKPNLANFTILGPNEAANTAANHNFANRFRRNTAFILTNSILLGHPDGGLSLESNGTYSAFIAGTSQFNNNLIFASTAPFKLGKDISVENASALEIENKAISNGTVKLASSSACGLVDPFNLSNPNFLPSNTSPALTGARFVNEQNIPFFEKVSYKGAFGTVNWTAQWASWTPKTNLY